MTDQGVAAPLRRVASRLRGGLRARYRRVRGRLVGTLASVRTDERVAALTFDDGPDARYTHRVLELLEDRGFHGTFFMIGCRAAEHPSIVERVAAAGHAIGNHTWDHPSMPALSAAERAEQVRRCARALAPHGSRLFRPPRLLQSVASYWTVRRLGYLPVGFNVEVADWKPQDAEWLADRLCERIHPGCIVVLHDTLWEPTHPEATDREPLLTGLADALDRLPDYRFVTVPELMKMGRQVRRPWFIRTDEGW